MNRQSILAHCVLTAAFICGGCSHSQNEADANSQSPSTAEGERQARLAKAAADGAAAGDALSRSIKLNQSRYRSTPVDTAEVKPPAATDATDQSSAPTKQPRMTADGYHDLDWLDIIPKEDVAALEDPANATVVKHVGNKRGKQVGTFHVVAGIDGMKAQLSGYVVPLETDDAGNLTEFLFVPFYGACIHVPPPPPNQIIYATLTHPMKAPEIWDPFWLKGVIRAHAVTNKMAGAAYTMDEAQLVPWNG